MGTSASRKRVAAESPSSTTDFVQIHNSIQRDDYDTRSYGEKGVQLTPRRVGPRLDEVSNSRVGTPRSGLSSLVGYSSPEPVEVQKSEHLKNCEIVYLSGQVLVASFESSEQLKESTTRAVQQCSTSIWSSGRQAMGSSANLRVSEERTMAAGMEVAEFMNRIFQNKYIAVLSYENLLKCGWTGSTDMVEVNPFEPPQLSYSAELVTRLCNFLRSDHSKAVLFMGANVNIMCEVLTRLGGGGSSVVNLHKSLCELLGEKQPCPASVRHLAMLHDVVRKPGILQSAPQMLVGSLRLFGDHEFVRSTENLLRVHVELHHSGVIDSTDFREQMHCRVTRSDDSDACLVLHFLPVELNHDVRAIVFSTLAGEMGLITGPQPMFQV